MSDEIIKKVDISEFKKIGISDDIVSNGFYCTGKKNRYFDIIYKNLDGGRITFKNPNFDPEQSNRSAKEDVYFERWRKVKFSRSDKYGQHKASGTRLFLTGIHTFNDGIDFDLPLCFVEGEKKAFLMCFKGIPTIGLTGINGLFTKTGDFINHAERDDIKELFNQAPGFCLLHDADAFDGSKKRKSSFYGSIKAFYNGFKKYDLPMNYAVVDSEKKGIDDAWCENPDASFGSLVQSFKMNEYSDLTEISKLFFKSSGVKKWDAMLEVIEEHEIAVKLNIRSGVFECSRGGIKFEKPEENIKYLLETTKDVDNIGKSTVKDMILSEAVCDYFDPIQSAFDRLPDWDGKDHIKELCKYVILEDDEDPNYFCSQLKKYLIRVVRQALEGGLSGVNRTVMHFHSNAENIGKSSFWRWLTPDGLYSETPIKPDNKDSLISLGTNLIINLDDIEGAGKKDLTDLKSIISSSDTSIRRPYGHAAEPLIRTASFVGSTNQGAFLNDGENTRWVIFTIKGFRWQEYIKIKGFQDNVWSQVLASFNHDPHSGEVSKDEQKVRKDKNRHYLYNSIEFELVQKFFISGEHDNPNYSPMTAGDVYEILTNLKMIKSINKNALYKELKKAFGEPKRTNSGRYYHLRLKTDGEIKSGEIEEEKEPQTTMFDDNDLPHEKMNFN